MVVPALVNPADRNNNHNGQLGVGKNCLGNSPHFYTDFGLVGVLSVTLASADEAQWQRGKLSANPPRFYSGSRRLIAIATNQPSSQSYNR